METTMETIRPRYTVPAVIIAVILALALISLPVLNAAATATSQAASTLTPPDPDTSQLAMATAAVAQALNLVEHNTDWTPHFQSFEGVEMALVPVGCFMMGSNDGSEDEKPVHQQCFNQPFWIDRTEVTRAQYQQCVDAGQCESPPASEYSTAPDQPINRVTWLQARTYCEWRSARLPTEREWEYAARGPDNLIYPWGNEFAADNVVYNTSGSSFVGSKPDGVSWVGAQDMSGNLWEWVSTIYDQDRFKYPYNPDDGREEISDSIDILRVTRGGSWESSDEFLPASNRSLSGPTTRTNYYGFRCARDY